MARKLSKEAVQLIHRAVEGLFDRLKARLIPENYQHRGLAFLANPDFTLKALFRKAGETEGAKPSDDTFNVLAQVATNYLDAVKSKTQAQTVHYVQNFLQNAAAKGVKTDVEKVLGGKLIDVMSSMRSDVKRIVETETQTIKNTGSFDAIGQIAAATGNAEPVVFWVVVRDGVRCSECTRLHLMPDKTTPRCWYMSEVQGGYHKKGEQFPKVAGLHPNCRCVLSYLAPGYGFTPTGRVTYIGPGHNEIKRQRG